MSIQKSSQPSRTDLLKQSASHISPVISVIVPTLDEANNLPLVLPYIPLNWVDEVVLVDGRSRDNTVEVARQLMPSIRIVYEKRPGKGAAMMAGYRASKGDILIVIDADGSHDPREIPRYITPLLEGADMVKGSRFTPGGGTTDMPRIRKLGNGSFVLMTNLLFSASFSDLCYGYHAFWRHCLKDLDITDKRGFEIDTALYLQALRKKLRIVEVPSFEGYRFFGVGKLQTIPDGFRVLRTIISEWLASLRPDQEELYIGFRGAAPQSDKLLQLGARSTVLKQVLLELHFMRLFGLLLFQDYPKDKALERVLQYSLEALNAESGSILFLDDEGQVTNALLAYEGIFHPNDSDIVNRIVSDGLAGWVVRNRRPALVYNTHEDPRWIKREWELAERLDGRSALSIPIVLEGRLTGVLTLVRNTPDHFTENDLNLLHQFSFGS